MNHLAHLALASFPGTEATPRGLIVGGFLGDHVKGRLKGERPTDIEIGIQLHRAIDAYTDQHAIVRRSQARLPPHFRRYSGIILDILFDHLLALKWDDYYPEPLTGFSTRVLALLNDHASIMPPQAAVSARRMQAHNSLAGHGDLRFVERSLTHLGTRLTRANPLGEAFDDCRLLLPEIEQDFVEFYPLLIDFCGEWIENK